MSGSSQATLQNINPFPGLRPFTSKEAHLFFGREGQVDEIVDSLKRNRFVAVVGASGSGKSSLIYCGVIPSLVKSISNDWLIVNTRPGNSPLFNLLNDLCDSSGKKPDFTNPSELFALKDGVLEYIKKVSGGKKNTLLMIDQFEEIFRFNKTGVSTDQVIDHNAYVNFIVDIVKQSKLPVYVVITMRSDFIGECSRFQEFTALINQSNYLVPRMTGTDFRKVIEGPVKVAGAEIDPILVEKLLTDLGDNPDQLPVLQHVLMRTWDYWKLHNDVSKPLSVSDYEAVGRIEKALSEHANEAFDELDETEKAICESIFRTITEKGGDNRGVRRPTRISQLCAISQASIEEVEKIINIFRAPGRSFIVPAYSVKLNNDSVIDISHESFMRIWERLRVWVDEEATAVQMYKRLAESADLFQSGKTNLWRPPDLQLALNWRTKTKPSLTWAERHDPAFERTMVFLESSEKEFLKEEENKIRLQKRQLRRTRIFALVLGSAAIVSMGLFVWTQQLRVNAENAAIEAKNQRTIAEEKTSEANKQKLLAEDAANEAKTQKSIAEESSSIAEMRRVEAENNLQEARRQEAIAQNNLSEANNQRKIALQNENEATKQKEQAEIARVEAFQRRMLSTAKSMAVKSIQMSYDPELKALMAYQAFQFNEKYKGIGHDVDIYSSLYQSLKTLLGQDYNVLKGHDNAVRSLIFVPGTSTLLSAGSDGKVLKWDINDLAKKSEIITENGGVIEKIQVSSNGKYLTTIANKGGISVYDLSKEKSAPRFLTGEDANIRTMVIGPDNTSMYSTGLLPIIEYWNLETGIHTKIAEIDSRINAIAISPDGGILAGGTKDGRLIIWRVKGGVISQEVYKDAGKSINALAFSPDGAFLTCGNIDGEVLLFTADTFQLVSLLTGHTARVTEVGFSPDSKTLATSSFDGKVLFWELANLTNPPIVMEDNSGFVFSLAFSPDGKYLLSSSADEPRLINRPTMASMLASQVCGLVTRNFTQDEWKTYVGNDVPYEKTCPAVNKLEIGIKKNEE